MEKVSIIVPVFNGENYLEECLKCIVNQTYPNIEIIIVDDGSEDRSWKIIESWAKKELRIKSYRNINQGVSHARNFAIEKSSGKYLTFIDADDLVDEDFVETLIEMFYSEEIDCTIVGIKGVSIKNSKNFSFGKCKVFADEEVYKALFEIFNGYLVNKMYKADIIKGHNLCLSTEIAVAEDLLFNINYLKYCKKVVYCDGIKYLYRQHADSTINNLSNIKWLDILIVYQKILDIFDNKPTLQSIVKFGYGMSLYEARYRAQFFGKEKSEILEYINLSWRRYINLRNSFTIRQKTKLFLFKYFPSIVMKYRRRFLKV